MLEEWEEPQEIFLMLWFVDRLVDKGPNSPQNDKNDDSKIMRGEAEDDMMLIPMIWWYHTRG